MEVNFSKRYLKELYVEKDAGKKHRFQPYIVRRYIHIINLMVTLPNVMSYEL